MKALGSNASEAADDGEGCRPMTSPAPVSDAPIRNCRRETATLVLSKMDIASPLGSQLDGSANARIRTASTDISGHDGIDIIVGRRRIGS